nr:DNA internalization-related competence protein ComEC/Rec2 [uncultured Oscillibacter sp.]
MRRLAVFAGAFSLGIFLAQYLLPYDWLLSGAVLCLCLGFGALRLPWEWRRRGVVIGAALALALGYDWLYVRQVQRPMEALADKEADVTMTLLDYAEPATYGVKATVRIEGLPGKAVYYGDETLLALQPGQTIRDRVSLRSSGRIRDEGVSVFTSKGVFLLAYAKGEAVFGPGTMELPRWWPVRLGRAMGDRIRGMMDGDAAGFLIAILTGETAGLSEGAAWDLSEAGMYHVLAVSGMHCGFLLLLLRAVIGRHRRRLLAGATAVLLAGYALLAGARPSMVRACVMLVLLLAAPLFRRESDAPTSLLTALFLILLANPFAAASIGLQLSFGAVAGIFWLTPRLYKMLSGEKKHGKVFRFIAAGFSTTMGALVLTTPLTAYYFGLVVLVSPISNLLCLGAASVVFISGLIAVFVGFLCPPLGNLLGLLPALLGRYILAMAHLLAGLPYHAVYLDNPYLKYWLAFTYLLFVAAFLLKPRTRRKYLVAALCGGLALAVTVHLGAARYRGGLDVLVLDVGQGQSVLLASDGHFALADCGSANNWQDPGETAVHHLRTMGCRTLDCLILTHYDSDHISGAAKVLEHLPVSALMVPELPEAGSQGAGVLETARARSTEVRVLAETETLDFGRASLTVYPPVSDRGDNERGLSVLASTGEKDLLITGDMDGATERKLLETYGLPDIEALVVGHHGSKYSTSDRLLDALTPETAVISVGANSYGHPADETLRRLAEHGCAIYRTDRQGGVHLSLN